ncbi:hypothetical protein M4R22_07245 [Acidovorax sp. GBBC 3334]|uniref:HD domain-containing protein n=1 Tax=Acidovorax sp. GBBC 3334 TaxID=2940496 RepID=UPI0023048C3A|nr:hypothetical protein [Acidovorax sp. GBBC 3334]MDA8454552.1 hypothetical protein [Acidovorax sp. GBBC 3334]
MAPDPALLLARWSALGQSLSREGPDWQAEGHRLLRHWSRWPRAYHDTRHLDACLRHWEAARTSTGPGAMANPAAVGMALWFHDAIYWPWSGLNEERSARWARRFMEAQGLTRTTVDRVEHHILATRHVPACTIDGDTRWMVDIDLAILGQPPEVYAEFERNVRREYRFVRWPRYQAGRCAILQSFLDRPAVYATPWFSDRYEVQARQNLRHALDRLRQGQAF